MPSEKPSWSANVVVRLKKPRPMLLRVLPPKLLPKRCVAVDLVIVLLTFVVLACRKKKILNWLVDVV